MPRDFLSNSSRVVVKAGHALVLREDNRAALGRVGHLCEELRDLKLHGRQVVLVTAGAFGFGARRLGFRSVPKRLADRQVCAAVGQVALIALFDHFLGGLGTPVGQILLTQTDFEDKERLSRATNTFEWLLAASIIPVVNINDAVAGDVLAQSEFAFSDNDKLAALLAQAIGAEALIILSQVPGILGRSPQSDEAELLSEYTEEYAVSKPESGGTRSVPRGGLDVQVEAAKLAASNGVPTVIADGMRPGVLHSLFEGKDVGTLFRAAKP